MFLIKVGKLDSTLLIMTGRPDLRGSRTSEVEHIQGEPSGLLTFIVIEVP